MDEIKILEKEDELKEIATYYEHKITETEFKNFFIDLKKFLIENEIKIPEIFIYTGSIKDFREKMQTYGGYQERRRVISDAVYELHQKILKINSQKIQNNTINNLNRKDIIKELKLNKEIVTKYGKITLNSLNIKEGGNSIVIFGKMQDKEIATKILISNSKSKKNRFMCEFANIIIKLDDINNIAKLYLYDTVKIGEYNLDIIVMKKYDKILEYNENSTEDEIINKFKKIIDCMEKVHKRGIIHRDLKPGNILIKDDDLFITDFGIAYYNPEIFEMTGNTVSNERLANFDFSAPEQRNSKIDPKATMDIYAIGQIVQWMVFGTPHKGTNRKKITEKFKDNRMKLLDKIVEKCLDNDPNNRYQSIGEIKEEILKYNNQPNIKFKTISEEKIIKKNTIENLNINEIKEKLINIMDNICGFKEKYAKFKGYCEFDNEEIEIFLNCLNDNLDKLKFFNKVDISKFIDGDFYKKELVDKIYYEELNELYNYVITYAPNLKKSFIEYVKTVINNNTEGLPF